MMDRYYEEINNLLSTQTPFVSVILVDATGSVPQDAGTKMLVTKHGLHYGTVGGGKVEKRAIDEAVDLLRSDDPSVKTKFFNWSLERDIGMTCGGMVKLFLEKHNTKTWNIVIFGAGHVANSLVQLLIPLECRITCIDPRPEWLEKLPEAPSLTKLQAENMVDQVKNIPDDSFVLLMTMGHTTDKPILLEILKTKTFPYLGVIGSDAKAIRLKQDILAEGLAQQKTTEFFCPIGLPLGSNHPREIAISIGAQLIQERDRQRPDNKKH